MCYAQELAAGGGDHGHESAVLADLRSRRPQPGAWHLRQLVPRLRILGIHRRRGTSATSKRVFASVGWAMNWSSARGCSRVRGLRLPELLDLDHAVGETRRELSRLVIAPTFEVANKHWRSPLGCRRPATNWSPICCGGRAARRGRTEAEVAWSSAERAAFRRLHRLPQHAGGVHPKPPWPDPSVRLVRRRAVQRASDETVFSTSQPHLVASSVGIGSASCRRASSLGTTQRPSMPRIERKACSEPTSDRMLERSAEHELYSALAHAAACDSPTSDEGRQHLEASRPAIFSSSSCGLGTVPRTSRTVPRWWPRRSRGSKDGTPTRRGSTSKPSARRARTASSNNEALALETRRALLRGAWLRPDRQDLPARRAGRLPAVGRRWKGPAARGAVSLSHRRTSRRPIRRGQC